MKRKDRFRVRKYGDMYCVEMRKLIGWFIFKIPKWVSIRGFWSEQEAITHKLRHEQNT